MNEHVDTKGALTEQLQSRDMTIGQEIGTRKSSFEAALPAHIPVERFQRVVLTAIQQNPALARADRASLWTSCMKAAQDGLLPDGRDGALVTYSTKKGGEWIDMVQWMPMVAGIRKKVRNSGEIATWDVHAVYAKDAFEYELGDDPFIKHKPFMAGDPGPLVAVYSVAVLKTGEKSRDVMTRSAVEYVRDTYSKKNRDGNFSPAWVKSFDEMAKKTVAHRHAKVLPISTDLDDLMRRDDALYDLEGKSDKALSTGPRMTRDQILDRLAGVEETTDDPSGDAIDPATGEIKQSAGAATGPEGDGSRAPAAAGSGSPDEAGAATSAASSGVHAPSSASEPTASAGAADTPQPQGEDRQVAPAATNGRPKAKAAPEASQGQQTPSDPLAALIATGDEKAKQGESALNAWLDNGVSAEDEDRLNKAGHIQRWVGIANAADQDRAAKRRRRS